MQLYELEKRMTMNVKYLAKQRAINTENLIVNIQTSKGAYGHYAKERWNCNGIKMHEIALNPDVFISVEQIIVTMIHELVHVYCDQNDIKDTSRGCSYHNKRFKEIAESFGLECVPDKKIGYRTPHKGHEKEMLKINEELPYPIDMKMYRISRDRAIINNSEAEEENGGNGENGEEGTEEVKPIRNKWHVLTCKKCGCEVKSKEPVFMICGKCREAMIPNVKDLKEYFKQVGIDLNEKKEEENNEE